MGRNSRNHMVQTLAVIFLVTFLCGCGGKDDSIWEADQVSTELNYDHSMKLDYAQGFSIDYYKEGAKLITIRDDRQFLLIPEGAEVPAKVKENVVVLKQPVDHIYLVASAVMDMFRAIDGLDAICLSGTKAEGWYIPEAKEAMEQDRISYAGKYNAPDYEQIVESGCKLSVQSTMILHAPEVEEKLQSFDIPVLIDRSSYETHPLGRCEWVKLYGALENKEDAAEHAFDEQKQALAQVEEAQKDTASGEKPTVAFFYVTTNGTVNVRKSTDYVPKMIELAGGAYIFQDLGAPERASSTVNMQMEEFYAGAKDADYLIYNSTIDGELHSVDELTAKSELFQEFRAVKTGNVYCTTENLYQDSMEGGIFISDIHTMLSGKENDDASCQYLFRLP